MDEQTIPTTAAETGGNQPEEAPEEHRKLIESWLERIQRAKKFHEDAFKRMREDQRFAANTKAAQWDGDHDKYVANITLRHVRNKVGTLYAKNPRVKAQRAERLEYTVWDGKIETLNAALATLQANQVYQQAMMTGVPPAPTIDNATGQPVPPPPPPAPADVAFAQQLVQDAVQGYQRKKLIERIGKTLEILFHHQMREQNPTFKTELKQCVRRTVTCGVGYAKMSFQRDLARDPNTIKQIADSTQRLAVIERLMCSCENPYEMGEYEKEKAELENALAALQQQGEVVVREGLIWSWPKSTQVIVDPRCTQLVGFINADWIATEHLMTCAEVEETFGIKLNRTDYRGWEQLSPGAKGVDSAYRRRPDGSAEEGDYACVYEVEDKKTGTVFFICDGYKNYLRPPAPPKVEREQFWSIDALVFNAVENEFELYPPSDVRLIMHQQREVNRSREALREHRRASPPRWGSTVPMDNEVRDRIKSAAAFEVIDLAKGLPAGAKVGDVFAPIPMAPIDPAMYDTNPIHEDVNRTAGAPDASFQVTKGGTATESTIAEGARVSSVDDNKDDLDEFLTSMARAGGQILLREMSRETVLKIVGPGAAWPEMSHDEIRQELYLEIIAGSSGRPNKAMDVANFERMAPTLLQLPGLKPEVLARHAVHVLDDRLDVDEWLLESNPSITAMNALAGKPAAVQPATGDAQTDPAAQGPAGGNQVPSNPTGAQPPPEGMFPAG